jgi:hypothetical protein
MSELTFKDALAMAKGCTDYGGGYHGEEWEIYQHGIQTVINVLTRANDKGVDSYQLKVLHNIGSKDLETEVK